ncbi:MAG: ABC transporter permease [Dehalococcoidia bacterium]
MIAASLALFARDLRAVVRSRSQLYSSMFTPLLLLVFLGVGVSEGLQPANLPAGDFKGYLVPGVVVMTCVFSSTFSSASFYRDRDSGVLRMLVASPQPLPVLLLGKSLAGVVIGTIQGAVVLIAAAPFVDLDWQYSLAGGMALAILVIVLLNVLLGGIAQVLASRIQTMQGFHLVMNLALFPLLFFSGAFFPLDDLPAWLQVLAAINPLTYAVDALLLATYAGSGEGFIGLAIDLPVLLVLAVAVFAAASRRTPRLTWSGV